MPFRSPLLLALALTLLLAVPAPAAPPVTVVPESWTGFDAAVSTRPILAREYDAFGLWFSDAGANTTAFAETARGWAGRTAEGSADLTLPVQARIVIPGSGGAPAAAATLSVEAGFVNEGIELEGYDCLGRSLGRITTGVNPGPHGRTLFTLPAPGAASFRVRTVLGDGFAVNQVNLGATTPCLDATVTAAAGGSAPVGAEQALAATVRESDAPAAGRAVTFTVLQGPNAGLERTATTGEDGWRARRTRARWKAPTSSASARWRPITPSAAPRPASR